MTTPQEEFWKGEFGRSYIRRNDSESLVAANAKMFNDVLLRTGKLDSVLEIGANIGLNLRALHDLDPAIDLSAVEINADAVRELRSLGYCNVHHCSAFDFSPPRRYSMTMTKGLLIHVAPHDLEAVYSTLYDASSMYILVCEYYNPTPVAIEYRGHMNRLWKRDFAGDLLDRYSDLKLVDYGFRYRRDNEAAQDDISWFLLEKSD